MHINEIPLIQSSANPDTNRYLPCCGLACWSNTLITWLVLPWYVFYFWWSLLHFIYSSYNIKIIGKEEFANTNPKMITGTTIFT